MLYSCGIGKNREREGCTLQISVTENAVEKERMLLKEFLRTSSIDGLIAEPVKSGLPNPNLGLYRELKSAGVPVLFVNSFYPEIDIPYVSLNDQKAGYIAARHLAELSQTPLTSLENPAEKLGRAAAEKIAACVKHGVKMDTQEFDPRLVIRNSVRMKTGEERKEEHAGTIKERSL